MFYRIWLHNIVLTFWNWKFFRTRRIQRFFNFFKFFGSGWSCLKMNNIYNNNIIVKNINFPCKIQTKKTIFALTYDCSTSRTRINTIFLIVVRECRSIFTLSVIWIAQVRFRVLRVVKYWWPMSALCSIYSINDDNMVNWAILIIIIIKCLNYLSKFLYKYSSL